MITDIFKLIFQHDMRLDKLAKRNANKNPQEVEATLEDFMKPDPTYSKFYLTGTDLENEAFGLDQITHYKKVVGALQEAFNDYQIVTENGLVNDLHQGIDELNLNEALVLSKDESPSLNITDLHLGEHSNVGHVKMELKEALEQGLIVIYKEQAKDGFDLHIFSKKNVYRDMFFPLQKLVPDCFRFFSINGRKYRSERHFYFETWTLDRPPHGFEEVFPESVL